MSNPLPVGQGGYGHTSITIGNGMIFTTNASSVAIHRQIQYATPSSAPMSSFANPYSTATQAYSDPQQYNVVQETYTLQFAGPQRRRKGRKARQRARAWQANQAQADGPVHHQQTQQQFRQPSHGPQAPRFNAFTPAQHTQTLSAFSVNPASSAYAANPYNTFGFTATSSYNTTHHGFFSATQSTIAQPTPAVKQEDGTAQQGFIYRASEQELQNMEQRAAPVQQEFGWKRRRLA